MLYYTDKGKGSAILFLHGFLETSEMWVFCQEELSKNYRVICIDLPGHGKSAEETKEVNRMEDMAEGVSEVLEHLGVEEVIVIGHSMGGYVALAFADLYRNKIQGLGLFYSTSLPDDEAKKEQRLKAAEVVIKNPKEFYRFSVSNLFNKNKLEDFSAQIKQAISWANETSLIGVSAALKGMRLRLDRTNVIKELGKPVFIITGIYDTAIKSKELKKAVKGFPNVSFFELSTGHMGALEAPEECLSIIKKWLIENF